MALRVEYIERAKPMGAIIADRPLCLAADRQTLVEAGDLHAAFVLVARAGKEIPAAEVDRLGLVLVKGRVQQGSAEPVAPAGDAEPEEASAPRRKKSSRE